MNIICVTGAEAGTAPVDRLMEALDPGELHGMFVHDGVLSVSVGAPVSGDVSRPPSTGRRPILLTH